MYYNFIYDNFLHKLERRISLMFIILILVAIYSFVAITSYSSSYAQKTILATTAKIIPLRISTAVNSPLDTSKTVATSVALIPKLKILSPYYGQKVPVTNNNSLVVYGTSSYDRSKNCSVSVLLNGVKPYQRTVATGNNGASDYSTWKYKLDHSYAAVKEGSNKLTAKITCLDNPYSLTKNPSQK